MKQAQSHNPADSPRQGVYKPMARSRVTNGNDLLPNTDHRTVWVRRFRDVLALHLKDLGGETEVSEAEKALARRSACLVVELEQLEQKFAAGEDTPKALESYQRCVNTLRRTLESLGLQRRARDVTPDPLFRQFIEAYNSPEEVAP